MYKVLIRMGRANYYYYFINEKKARKFAEKQAEYVGTNGTVGLFELEENEDGVLKSKNCIGAW